jgi:pimeloyl-ACP methyl ester carboxylesterase
VAHGFRSAPEGVRLKCDPEYEALTFERSWSHPVWEQLPEIRTPVVVIRSGDADGPATVAAEIAERLPCGELVQRPDWTHFGPFEDPRGAADEIAAAVAR